MGLFGREKPKPRRFVEGRVGYAVGDIHGRADLLARLFDRLEAEPRASGAASIVIFLGDYVDRGPDSSEVIELLMSGRPEGFERYYLKGNHEEAMLAFLADPVAGKAWLTHGGLETLGSYGVAPLPSLGASTADIARAGDLFRAKLPDTHLAFLNQLERYRSFGDFVFVHAGVDPARKLEAQADRDLFWIRGRFLESDKAFSHIVVHGHTPTDQPYRDHRRIGLDTGAYFSGALSAARFEADDVRFIDVR